jgi:hypothetical protein
LFKPILIQADANKTESFQGRSTAGWETELSRKFAPNKILKVVIVVEYFAVPVDEAPPMRELIVDIGREARQTLAPSVLVKCSYNSPPQ